jgi:hypothetical protein
MTNSNKDLRLKLRKLIKEELSRQSYTGLIADLEEEIADEIDETMMEHDVHKKGLAPNQAARIYKRLCDVVSEKLDEFTTIRKPNDLPYDDYMDRV